MKGIIKLACLVWILACIMAACTYKKGEIAQPKTLPTDTTTKNTVVSFKNDIEPIMVTYCLGQAPQRCHVMASNQNAATDFSTYPDVKKDADNGTLKLYIGPNSPDIMPKSTTTGPKIIATADYNKLIKWIDAGALDN